MKSIVKHVHTDTQITWPWTRESSDMKLILWERFRKYKGPIKALSLNYVSSGGVQSGLDRVPTDPEVKRPQLSVG